MTHAIKISFMAVNVSCKCKTVERMSTCYVDLKDFF